MGSTSAIQAQYSQTANINQQLRHLFGQISFPDPNIEFLNERSAKLADSLLYQTNNPDIIYQMQWSQVYKEMYYAAHDTLAQQPFNDVMLGVNNYGQDTITMGIMDWQFYRVKPQATTSQNYFVFDTINNYFLDHLSPIASPYTIDNVFMAAPLIHEANYLQVVYNIDPNYIFRDNNTALNYQGSNQLQIDFDDGNGFVNINSATQNFITITYPNNGNKTIKTYLFNSKGQIIKSSKSGVFIKNNVIPTKPDAVLTNIPGMTVNVYNACNPDPTTNRKIIVLEGYDMLDEIPSANNTATDLYEGKIRDKNLSYLENYGYEYYVVDWEQSKIDVRFNAYNLLLLIEHLKNTATNAAEFVILGHSMGGIVAKYTLNYMESQAYQNHDFSPFFVEASDPSNITYLAQHPNYTNLWQYYVNDKYTHNTRLLITVDSPHQGANIPVAYQFLFRKLQNIANLIPGFALLSTQIPQLNIVNILNAKASRQLLKWYVPSFPTPISSAFPPNASHHSFYNQLNTLNNGTGMPKLAKTVALSDGALNGSPQQDPNTNNSRQFNDDLLNFEFNSYVKILWIPFNFVNAQARLKTNPNGFGEIAHASYGKHFFSLKLKFWSVKITTTYVPLIPLLSKYAIDTEPTCVTAGGYTGFFIKNNDIFNSSWNLWGGFLGYHVNMSITSNGAGFCFVPLESALDYNGSAPYNNNITATNINTKLSNTPFDVIAGQVILGKNPLTDDLLWKNHEHTFNRNENDYIYNLTQQPATTTPIKPNDIYAFYTCAADSNYNAKRTFLSLEIGDEELYLENFSTDRNTFYRTEFDVKVNVRNPHYEYSSQSFIANNDMLSGVYSKEEPFNIVGNGFAKFYYDSNSPSPSPGLTINYINSSSYSKIDEPLVICCSAPSAIRLANNNPTTEPLKLNTTTPEKLTIYPNPAKEHSHLHIVATFKTEETTTQLRIYNATGKLIATKTVQLVNGKLATTLDLNHLKKGIYLVKLIRDKQVLNTKFIIN